MTKPLQEKTNAIVNYVRQKTKDTNDWVHIGNRDIPRIFKISQMYASRLLEAIKVHPNIIYEVDHKFPTRFKPYKFKWVTPEEKINTGLSTAQFYWLSEEEVKRLKEIDPENSYDTSARILRICNLLASEGAKEWWTVIDVDTMSDFVVASKKETKAAIDKLINANVLVKADKFGLYRLVLDPNLYHSIKEEAKADEVRVKPKQERKKRKADQGISSTDVLPEQTDQSSIGILPEETGQSNYLPLDKNRFVVLNDKKASMQKQCAENCIDNCSDLPIMPKIDQYTAFEIAEENVKILEQVSKSALTAIQLQRAVVEQLNEKEAVYERSYKAFLALENEHIALMAKLEKANEELSRLKIRAHELESESKKLCDYNERVMIYAQARMDVMLGQISSFIDGYTARPIYEKKDEVVAARLKKSIWESVLGTMNEIVNYKPESKAVPDLR